MGEFVSKSGTIQEEGLNKGALDNYFRLFYFLCFENLNDYI